MVFQGIVLVSPNSMPTFVIGDILRFIQNATKLLVRHLFDVGNYFPIFLTYKPLGEFFGHSPRKNDGFVKGFH